MSLLVPGASKLSHPSLCHPAWEWGWLILMTLCRSLVTPGHFSADRLRCLGFPDYSLTDRWGRSFRQGLRCSYTCLWGWTSINSGKWIISFVKFICQIEAFRIHMERTLRKPVKSFSLPFIQLCLLRLSSYYNEMWMRHKIIWIFISCMNNKWINDNKADSISHGIMSFGVS